MGGHRAHVKVGEGGVGGLFFIVGEVGLLRPPQGGGVVSDV